MWMLLVQSVSKSQPNRSARFVCPARFEDPLHPVVCFRLVDELYFAGSKVECGFDEVDPAVELVRGLFINRPARFPPILRFQPRLSMLLARKRALIALNALWPVIGITLVAERRR